MEDQSTITIKAYLFGNLAVYCNCTHTSIITKEIVIIV